MTNPDMTSYTFFESVRSLVLSNTFKESVISDVESKKIYRKFNRTDVWDIWDVTELSV